MTQDNRRKTLIILNGPPYGTESSWNGLRLAIALSKDSQDEVRVFLLSDSVICAKRDQQTPQGYYNIERMLKVASRRGVAISTCGTCLDARGIGVQELVEGVPRSSLDELAAWTRWADKVIVF